MLNPKLHLNGTIKLQPNFPYCFYQTALEGVEYTFNFDT